MAMGEAVEIVEKSLSEAIGGYRDAIKEYDAVLSKERSAFQAKESAYEAASSLYRALRALKGDKIVPGYEVDRSVQMMAGEDAS